MLSGFAKPINILIVTDFLNIVAMDVDEIISDEDDVNEEVCMRRVQLAFENLKEEDDAFMKLLLLRIDDMVVTWDHPWYQQIGQITRCPKFTEDNQVPHRTDSFCKAECDRVDKNWRKFRKKFNLPDTPICIARWRNRRMVKKYKSPEETVRRFVTAYLARGLERNLYQVYRHIVTRYGAPVKGEYSEKEQKLMRICFKHNPENATVYLSTILGREPRGIYKRLHVMQKGQPEKKRHKWTLERATKFLRLVLEYTKLKLKQLKHHLIDISIWQKLENEMDSDYTYLHRFWYKCLHVQLFVKCDVKRNSLRKLTLKLLMSIPTYQVWSDIRWQDLLIYYPDGFTKYHIQRVLYNALTKYPGNYLSSPLKEVLEFVRIQMKTFKNTRLKTLSYNTETGLQFVKYDIKLRNCMPIAYRELVDNNDACTTKN